MSSQIWKLDKQDGPYFALFETFKENDKIGSSAAHGIWDMSIIHLFPAPTAVSVCWCVQVLSLTACLSSGAAQVSTYWSTHLILLSVTFTVLYITTRPLYHFKKMKHIIYEFHFRLIKGEYKIFITKKGELGLMEWRTTNIDVICKKWKTPLPLQYFFLFVYIEV